MKIKINDLIVPFVTNGNYEVIYPIYRVFNWLKDIEKDKDIFIMDLNPDFQRPLTWDNERCSAYIEYIIRGGQSGRVLYFNCSNWGAFSHKAKFQLIDGKQRLEALRKFVDNEIPIFKTVYFKDIEDIHSLGNITIHVNSLKTRKDVLNWYLGINAGGIPHTQDEINRIEQLIKEEDKNGKN